MKALENGKYFLCIFHLKTNSIVSKTDLKISRGFCHLIVSNVFFCRLLAMYYYNGLLIFPHKFQRVGDQVLKQLAELRWNNMRFRQYIIPDDCFLLFNFKFKCLQGLFKDL